MSAVLDAAQGSIIQKYQKLASGDIIKAVQDAARKTGVDFSFLMQKASAESSFNPTAKAKTSSATGLYQFIDSTWLNMVKKHGETFGLGEYADKIEMKNGKAVCASADDRQDILALRNDPELSALMAGAFTAENQDYLEKNTRGDVGATELYFAHFMGAGGATKFLNSRAANGDTVAAELFPAAASANKNVFYDKNTGKARTLNEVYAFFDKKFGSSCADATPATQVAAQSSTASAARMKAPETATLQSAKNSIPAAVLAQLSADSNASLTNSLALLDGDDSDTPQSGFAKASNPFGFQKLSPVSFLMLAEIQQELMIPGENTSRRYNA